MATKRKTRFNSLSTPGLKQAAPAYLVELVFLRSNRGIKLPPNFWRMTKYKFRYMREIKACNKFIKKYGEAAILNIVQNNYIKTFTDYGKMEFFLQQYAESIARKAAPKDSTSVKELSSYKGEDLRNYQPSNRKKTLFEKLEEIENG